MEFVGQSRDRLPALMAERSGLRGFFGTEKDLSFSRRFSSGSSYAKVHKRFRGPPCFHYFVPMNRLRFAIPGMKIDNNMFFY